MSDERSSKRILLIDDDEDLRIGAGARLRAAGYETCLAADGLQGLVAAAENAPDAILLDLRMPEMDGLTALEQLKLREDTRHIPVVILSACVASQQAALDRGARFFLSKPYEGKTLLAAVESAIRPQPCSHQPASTP